MTGTVGTGMGVTLKVTGVDIREIQKFDREWGEPVQEGFVLRKKRWRVQVRRFQFQLGFL
jgi:hypothetical protein